DAAARALEAGGVEAGAADARVAARAGVAAGAAICVGVGQRHTLAVARGLPRRTGAHAIDALEPGAARRGAVATVSVVDAGGSAGAAAELLAHRAGAHAALAELAPGADHAAATAVERVGAGIDADT